MQKLLIVLSLFIFACDEEPDCAGVPGGGASEDDCGICSGGTTGLIANDSKDCAGVCFGPALLDECNVCGGTGPEDNFDCNNNCLVEFDCFDICGGTAVEDCDGSCDGNSELDICDVCNGDNVCDEDGDGEADEPSDCSDGYIDDCSGDGDCCPEDYLSDGLEDCEDQMYGCDLTCYDNDGGDCDGYDPNATSCVDEGLLDDCSNDGDCCSPTWLDDGVCDDQYQPWGCDLTCYSNDGGDCDDGCISDTGYEGEDCDGTCGECCAPGTYFDGGSCYDCNYCCNILDDSACGGACDCASMCGCAPAFASNDIPAKDKPKYLEKLKNAPYNKGNAKKLVERENQPYNSRTDVDCSFVIGPDADCFGECGGSAVEDECGVCNGIGIPEGDCDCDGNVADCFGECGGSAIEDSCGVCGGDGPEENYDCDGNCLIGVDCFGICGGTSQLDACGICDGQNECEEDSDCEEGYIDDCSGDGDCCPLSYLGDGYGDCEDQMYGCDLTCYDNDNGDCDVTACPDGQFDCGDGSCVYYSWVCDGMDDCSNGADESNCGSNCSDGEFDCGNGSCVYDSWVCDGWDDCGNGSDEDNCGSGDGGWSSCDEGYVDDCSGDGDCCDEDWIGDSLGDCQDQAYGCDLTCYDNDGGDCDEGGSTGGTCDDCYNNYSYLGSECCDTAWEEFGFNCSYLEYWYGWDCSGCSCPGDALQNNGDENDKIANLKSIKSVEDGNNPKAIVSKTLLEREGKPYKKIKRENRQSLSKKIVEREDQPYNRMRDRGCFAIGPDADCSGVCYGTAVEDECGVCDGSGVGECGCDYSIEDLGCGCGNPGPSGCDEQCFSDLEFDECGVCDGDGTSIFCVDNDGDGNGMSGTEQEFCEAPSPIWVTTCTDTDEECFNENYDCFGICDGDTQLDECGVCDGDGIPDGDCDCYENILDECGECGGDGIPSWACDCEGNVAQEYYDCDGNCVAEIDCAGECGGSAVEDECGECGGDGSSCSENPGDWCSGCGSSLCVYDCVGSCVDYNTAMNWIGDGYCDDGEWGMYLDCPEFSCDDGDCPDLNCDGGTGGGGNGGGTCDDCYYDWTNYGSECCDSAWDEYGISCSQLESNYGWDCSGCSCPGDWANSNGNYDKVEYKKSMTASSREKATIKVYSSGDAPK